MIHTDFIHPFKFGNTKFGCRVECYVKWSEIVLGFIGSGSGVTAVTVVMTTVIIFRCTKCKCVNKSSKFTISFGMHFWSFSPLTFTWYKRLWVRMQQPTTIKTSLPYNQQLIRLENSTIEQIIWRCIYGDDDVNRAVVIIVKSYWPKNNYRYK